MKKYILITLMVAGMASCVKDPNPDKPVDPNQSTEFVKMNVPESFDWANYTNILCDFKSDTHTSLVSLYLPTETEPFASFYVGKGLDEITLPIANDVKSVIVKYVKDGSLSSGSTLNISNGVISYSVPNDSQDFTNVANEVLTKDKDFQQNIYYPTQNGMGTIMFEDLWPFYGDFDMNDLVMNYNIELNFNDGNNNNKNKAKVVYLSLRIAAIGGSQPYNLYLRLKGVKGKEVDAISVLSYSNTITKPSATSLDPDENQTKGSAILKFNDILENAKRPASGSFLNVNKGYEMNRVDLVNVKFRIEFKNAIAIEDLTLDKFDFFIAKTEASALKEIHLSANAPTKFGQNLYEQLKQSSSVTKNANGYYKSISNLVWGINIPKEIGHSYETVDFTEAYPLFKDWAESGGNRSINWYNAPASSNVVKKHLQ